MNQSEEVKLHKYIKGLLGKPFQFGQNDCPLLAAGALDVMSGSNHREKMIGWAKDKKSAWVYMKRNGTISDHLKREGCVNIDHSLMTVGDFILMHQDLAHQKQWHSVAICLGLKAAIVSDEEGVIIVDMKQLPEIDEVLRWQ